MFGLDNTKRGLPRRYSVGVVDDIVPNSVEVRGPKRPGLLRRLSTAFLVGVDSKPIELENNSSEREDFEQWRWRQPVNMEDPVSIRRKPHRRVTFDVRNQPSVLHSTQSEENIVQCYSEEGNESAEHLATGEDDIWSKTKRKSISDFRLLSSTKENKQELETHFNTTFKFDEENQDFCFISAFGTKGKKIGQYQDAKSITCLPPDRILITDYVNNRLQICNESSKTVTVFSEDDTLLPWAAAVTKENYIAVTLCTNRCVQIFNTEGDVVSSFGEDYFATPTGLAIDKNGNFIVCDSSTDKVLMFDAKGKFVRYLGNPDIEEESFRKPCYVCVSVTDDVIVSDGGHHKIKVFNSEGDYVRSFGSFGKGNKQLKTPYGVATNKYGDILVADHYNSRISMFTRDGVFIRHIVTSEHGLVHPQGLTITPDLRMYVSHGHLKASEILVFKLTTDINYECSEFISYV